MVYREMTKLQKRQSLTRKEKDDLRRKKLVEVRRGQGAGRPFKPALHNTREQLNMLREKEMTRVRNNMNLAGADYELAQRYAIFERPENPRPQASPPARGAAFTIKVKRKGRRK